MNFNQGRRACSRRGGRLAHVYNGRENSAILRLLRRHPRGRVLWLGLNDKRREGRWVWNNNRRVGYR